ncbi:MAG: Hpt domain-containing protein [Oscillospiraceae bacterium]
MNFDLLINAGIDAEDAVKRFMGNESLFARMLAKFLDDSNYDNLVRAIPEKSESEALTASHTLKGLCGNLSMNELYRLFSEQVTLFRADKWDEACAMMPEISENYTKITDAIKAWLEQQ